jgi:hypothetical protein
MQWLTVFGSELDSFFDIFCLFGFFRIFSHENLNRSGSHNLDYAAESIVSNPQYRCKRRITDDGVD